MDSNMLEGPIPSAFGQCKALKVLVLDHNHLTGPVPRSLGECIHLEILLLDHNRLQGVVPSSELALLTKLRSLGLGDNEQLTITPDGKHQIISEVPQIREIASWPAMKE